MTDVMEPPDDDALVAVRFRRREGCYHKGDVLLLPARTAEAYVLAGAAEYVDILDEA